MAKRPANSSDTAAFSTQQQGLNMTGALNFGDIADRDVASVASAEVVEDCSTIVSVLLHDVEFPGGDLTFIAWHNFLSGTDDPRFMSVSQGNLNFIETEIAALRAHLGSVESLASESSLPDLQMIMTHLSRSAASSTRDEQPVELQLRSLSMNSLYLHLMLGEAICILRSKGFTTDVKSNEVSDAYAANCMYLQRMISYIHSVCMKLDQRSEELLIIEMRRRIGKIFGDTKVNAKVADRLEGNLKEDFTEGLSNLKTMAASTTPEDNVRQYFHERRLAMMEHLNHVLGKRLLNAPAKKRNQSYINLNRAQYNNYIRVHGENAKLPVNVRFGHLFNHGDTTLRVTLEKLSSQFIEGKPIDAGFYERLFKFASRITIPSHLLAQMADLNPSYENLLKLEHSVLDINSMIALAKKTGATAAQLYMYLYVAEVALRANTFFDTNPAVMIQHKNNKRAMLYQVLLMKSALVDLNSDARSESTQTPATVPGMQPQSRRARAS